MGIMCRVMRGEFIESMHVAYVVAVDDKGEIIKNWGDPYYLTCIRSSLKPFQASASVSTGAVDAAGFTEKELALMCASHNGESIHVEAAQGMLDKLGFDISHYECGSHPPYDKESKFELIRQTESPSPLHNNCSGKHAGMLCLAKHLGADTNGYTAPDHPVQQAIIDKVKEFSELEELPFATDGCSAPVPFLPLYNFALMYQKLGSGKYDELNRVFIAMSSHPFYVGGTERFDTDFMSVMGGTAITKIGGEAVRGMAIKKEDGTSVGIAAKMLDGSHRCMPTVALAVLEDLNLIDASQLSQLEKYRNITLKNHRKLAIGSIEVDV